MHGLSDEFLRAVGIVIDLLERTRHFTVVSCMDVVVQLGKERRLYSRSSLPMNLSWSLVVVGEVSSDIIIKLSLTNHLLFSTLIPTQLASHQGLGYLSQLVLVKVLLLSDLVLV